MLLNTAIATQQSLYSDIQIQIDALQEQQREIQSYLQRLGSVESRMESAAQLLQQAIADIQEVCPDELDQYKNTIDSLFNGHTAAFIASADDNDPNPDNDPTPPTPPTPPESETETVTVNAVAVVDSAPVSPVVPATVDNANPAPEKGGAISVTLPTVAQVPGLKKADLIQHLQALGLSTEGSVKDLKIRLGSFVMQRNAPKAA